MVRLAVLRFGDQWSVQSEHWRMGHFEQAESALRMGIRLAQAAACDGEQVELLVQDNFGALERFSPADATRRYTLVPEEFRLA